VAKRFNGRLAERRKPAGRKPSLPGVCRKRSAENPKESRPPLHIQNPQQVCSPLCTAVGMSEKCRNFCLAVRCKKNLRWGDAPRSWMRCLPMPVLQVGPYFGRSATPGGAPGPIVSPVRKGGSVPGGACGVPAGPFTGALTRPARRPGLGCSCGRSGRSVPEAGGSRDGSGSPGTIAHTSPAGERTPRFRPGSRKQAEDRCQTLHARP
jgi:hypothetical protein